MVHAHVAGTDGMARHEQQSHQHAATAMRYARLPYAECRLESRLYSLGHAQLAEVMVNLKSKKMTPLEVDPSQYGVDFSHLLGSSQHT